MLAIAMFTDFIITFCILIVVNIQKLIYYLFFIILHDNRYDEDTNFRKYGN